MDQKIAKIQVSKVKLCNSEKKRPRNYSTFSKILLTFVEVADGQHVAPHQDAKSETYGALVSTMQ